MTAPLFTRRRVGGFLFAGSIGFLVDLAGFATLVQIGAPAWTARAGASAVAILATWFLNRTVSFRGGGSTGGVGELSRYVAASLVGAASNLAAFAVCYGLLSFGLPLSYVAGTAAGLVINYLGYAVFVFRKRAEVDRPA